MTEISMSLIQNALDSVRIGLPFCFLKCCFPENSSCGQFSLSFFSRSLWNKLFQRRNGHITILSGPTYMLLQE